MFSIRYKILIVALPLFLVSMILIAVISLGLAKSGIDKVARELLGYKINQILQRAQSELESLEELNLRDFEGNREIYINSIKHNVEEYSSNITKPQIESVIAVDSNGIVKMSTDPFFSTGSEIDFFNQMKYSDKGWVKFKIRGFEKVGFYRYFEEWDWYFLLSVHTKMFYKDANQIVQNSTIILIISAGLLIILLFFFINYLFKPLKNVVSAMNDIIKLNDLSKRVPILFNDEIGELAFTFNNMLEELETAYNQIKEYAYQSVLAQKKEERIKIMFQKYVPQDVVDEIVHNPTNLLEGRDKDVTVLFSDIRSFTTISESMAPDVLVESLNSYFTIMVDIIYKRRGVIDKYIGDAIMAVFGAPKEYGDDIQQAVLAGLEMLENLEDFNKSQIEKKRKEFDIGVGINYGPVTVGNIGTSQKMDYTVIGDAVNLASRLESLTKEYKIPIIVSDNTKNAVKNYFYFREIDRVRVKGKLKPVKIWQPARKLTNKQKAAWTMYNKAVSFFLTRDWNESERTFIKVLDAMRNDYITIKYLEQIKYFKQYPPSTDWDGTTTMTHK
ncbi:MAG: adenylate/guanylate cyclase domain-containing protein [Spirochaetes bacterium]|nr:adenylate/guanylate cyclase domain-containing protein [Spirochaetota bacterium]